MFLAVVFCIFGFLPAYGQSKIGIRIAPEATIEKDRIALGDISIVSGDGGSTERLKAISLGYAPNVGMNREIGRAQIILAILAAGFAESELALESPLKILIRRAGQSVSPEQIRDAVEGSVKGVFPADKIDVRILRLESPPGFTVPTGKLEIRANLANIRNPFARFSLPIEIRVANKIVRTFAVNIEIEAFANVLIAAKDLTANTKISETDVRVERKRLEKPLASYVLDTKALRGGMLVKSITAGSEITTDSFVAGVVIKFGDAVRLEAVSGTLKVTINGEARSAGKIGDRIAVKNLQSGAILQAFVVDEGIARVAF